uniref:Uncharacterized protein n=1 Tax=Glossina brevipalpis TaxID=37001 RepID=A0A1A9W7H0_9MUSC
MAGLLHLARICSKTKHQDRIYSSLSYVINCNNHITGQRVTKTLQLSATLTNLKVEQKMQFMYKLM